MFEGTAARPPMNAGYSNRSLAAKLGIRPGTAVTTVGAPPVYRELLRPIPADVTFVNRVRAPARFVHCFVTRRRELERELPRLTRALADDGVLWVSWPKRASRVETDVTEDVVREAALPYGLVDVKVCAVDGVWSGLKLVRRLARRRG